MNDVECEIGNKRQLLFYIFKPPEAIYYNAFDDPYDDGEVVLACVEQIGEAVHKDLYNPNLYKLDDYIGLNIVVPGKDGR